MVEPGFVSTFVKETWEDFNSPTTSNFSASLSQLKKVVTSQDQDLEVIRCGLTKLRKSVKAVVNSGNVHVSNVAFYAESLEKLGHPKFDSTSDIEPDDVGNAFIKFAVVAKELSALMKNLMQNFNNMILFPLESFGKQLFDGKEGSVELKRGFEKSWKEYDQRIHKLEKEQLRLAESAGLVRTEVSGAAIAEDSERERKQLQLNLTEYLLRVHEVELKRPADLLAQLVEYNQAQLTYFNETTKTLNYFSNFTENLRPKMSSLKQSRDQDKSNLAKLRDSLRVSLDSPKLSSGATGGSGPAPRRSVMEVTDTRGLGCERTGYLLKKSEGKIKKVWQKRKCVIQGGVMYISHSDESKQPVRINLLTCQAKVVEEDVTKKCFSLISSSNNRTYHFQAEDDKEMYRWITVLNNAKEEQLQKAFSDSTSGRQTNQNVKELTNKIIEQVKLLPGNDLCCDCQQSDPEWLSTNFGVLICLECCGVHREMGVHISRTQSIVIDDLGTSQLLLARHIGNKFFNDTMEGTLAFEDKVKLISPDSPREQRNAFIRSKYVGMSHAIKTQLNKEELKKDLSEAVAYGDLSALLQCFAEGVDLMSMVVNEQGAQLTALHLAIEEEDGTTLYMIDFILQNVRGSKLDKLDEQGNSVLHTCARNRQPDAMKLLLRTCQTFVSMTNGDGKTALDIATEMGDELCVELLKHALEGECTLFENISFDWEFLFDYDHCQEYSDDDLDCVNSEKGASLDWRAQGRGRRGHTDLGDLADSYSLSSAASMSRDRDRRKTVDNIMDRRVLETCPIAASNRGEGSIAGSRLGVSGGSGEDHVSLHATSSFSAASHHHTKRMSPRERRKTTDSINMPLHETSVTSSGSDCTLTGGSDCTVTSRGSGRKKGGGEVRRKTTENVMRMGPPPPPPPTTQTSAAAASGGAHAPAPKAKSSSLKFKGKHGLSLPGSVVVPATAATSCSSADLWVSTTSGGDNSEPYTHPLARGPHEIVRAATLGRRHYSDSKAPSPVPPLVPPTIGKEGGMWGSHGGGKTAPVGGLLVGSGVLSSRPPSMLLSPPPPLPEKLRGAPGSLGPGIGPEPLLPVNGQTFFTFKNTKTSGGKPAAPPPPAKQQQAPVIAQRTTPSPPPPAFNSPPPTTSPPPVPGRQAVTASMSSTKSSAGRPPAPPPPKPEVTPAPRSSNSSPPTRTEVAAPRRSSSSTPSPKPMVVPPPRPSVSGNKDGDVPSRSSSSSSPPSVSSPKPPMVSKPVVVAKPAPPPRRSTPSPAPSAVGKHWISNNNSPEFQPTPQPRARSSSTIHSKLSPPHHEGPINDHIMPTEGGEELLRLGNKQTDGSLALDSFQRCRALFDCPSDSKNALSFRKGEIIVILRNRPGDLWEGEIDGNPQRRGFFSNSLVTLLGQEV